MRFWVKKHGGMSDDISVYADHLNELLNCDSEDRTCLTDYMMTFQ